MIRIVLADDHTMLRQGLRLLLDKSEDMEIVAEAGRGDEALDLIRRHRPDVALLDISMPGIDGISVAARIALERLPTRVLILTTYDDPDMIKRAAAAGVRGYVPKERAFELLTDAIRQVAAGASMLNEFLPEAGYSNPQSVTTRELEVLELLSRGLTNRLVAQRLSISIKTVDSHRTNLMRKFDVHSTVELVCYALKTGLLASSPALKHQ